MVVTIPTFVIPASEARRESIPDKPERRYYGDYLRTEKPYQRLADTIQNFMKYKKIVSFRKNYYYII